LNLESAGLECARRLGLSYTARVIDGFLLGVRSFPTGDYVQYCLNIDYVLLSVECELVTLCVT